VGRGGGVAPPPQHRVPRALADPFGDTEQLLLERPTTGYGLLSAGGGVRWSGSGRLHTITVQADNVTDAAWRDHLSRIKDVAPQPGRNIRFLYRVQL
jgi:hypothetical protein